MRKIIIISHFDGAEKKIDLTSMSPSIAEFYTRMFRWNRIFYNNSLWEELHFLSHIHNKKSDFYNIWEMPSYAPMHIKNVIEKWDPSIDTIIIDDFNSDNKKAIKDKIIAFNPTCIFLSTTFCLSLGQLQKMIEEIRSFLSDIPIIVGGNFIYKEFKTNIYIKKNICTLGSNIFFVNSLFGEEEINQILTGNLSNVKSIISVDEKGDIVSGPCHQEEHDIDKWSIAYQNLNYDKNIAQIRTSSGCSFNCSFCSYPTGLKKYLQKDISTIINELKALDHIGVKQVVFIDNTLNFPIRPFKELLKEMVKNKLTRFQCFSFCRCQYLDKEIVALMKTCGFKAVLLGLESASESILKNMNKRANASDYFRGIELLKEKEIHTFGAIIIGFPGETTETVKETVRFLNTSGLDYCYIQPFYYLHNAPIHRQREHFNLKGSGLRWEHSTMTSVQCVELLNQVFFEINGPIYAHEEYTMWEYIYLTHKGFNDEFYRRYRNLINKTRAINIKFGHSATQDVKVEQLINEFK